MITPYPPDASAFDKEILRRIAHLEARNLEVEDTNSIDLTKTGDWKKIVEGAWDPTTNNWTVPDNIITIKADSKIGSGTQKVTLNGKEYDLPNAIKVTDSGIFAPDYGKIIGDLSKQVNDSNNALKQIIKSLIDNGAWDPNASSDSAKDISLSGRCVVFPLGFLAALYFLPLDRTLCMAILILASCPAGSLTAVLAKQYDTEGELASQAVAHSTLCILISVPLVLSLGSTLLGI